MVVGLLGEELGAYLVSTLAAQAGLGLWEQHRLWDLWFRSYSSSSALSVCYLWSLLELFRVKPAHCRRPARPPGQCPIVCLLTFASLVAPT